jgi:Ser/Thr protein kinase RdoA (MazF antagonist)
MKAKVAKRVREWEEAGWIAKANEDCSNWNILFLPARKKLGGIVDLDDIRLCLDFKRVNAVTRPP